MSESKAQPVSRLYLTNLVVFVLVIVAVVAWFSIHLESYVKETRLLGGTVGLWVLWKLVQTWVGWGLKEASTSLTKSFLGRSGMTEMLVLTLILFTFLLFTTASMHLTYEGSVANASEYKVEVTRAGRPIVPTLVVSSWDQIESRPFFLRFGSGDLKFEIVSPGGYDPLTRTMAPGRAIRLRVPADFEAKSLHLVRLVPGMKIHNQLPKTNDTPETTFYMQVVVRDSVYEVDDMRRRSVWVGARAGDLRRETERMGDEHFRETANNYLAQMNVPQEGRVDLISAWAFEPLLLPTLEFSPQDTVLVRIGQTGGSTLAELRVVPEKELTTVFVEED